MTGSRGGLHYFRIHANPSPGSRHRRRGGVYVSCWIDFPLREGALVLAKYYVRQEGWRVRSVQDQRWVTRRQYARSPELKYYDEAAADGASFVFHTYPRTTRQEAS